MNRYEVSADSQEVTDHKTGLIWRQAVEPGVFTWAEAQDHANSIAQQTNLPWRMPTVEELGSLLDRSRYEPASAFPDMPSEWFWTALLCVDCTSYAWYVDFSYGDVSGNHRSDSGTVRLVRGG